MRIPLGRYAPDVAELDTGVAAVAQNVLPAKNSYRPCPGGAAFSAALDSNPRGLWMAQTNAGDYDVFAATDTTLEKLNGTAWDELGSGFSPPSDENWSGVQFGTTFLFTNLTDGLQEFDIEAGSSTSATAGAPKARFVDVVDEYVMLGSISTNSKRVAWSDTNDHTEWSSGNSGAQSFPDGGSVMAICGAAHLIIQETCIRRIVSDPAGDIFAFEKIAQSRGTIAPQSVIRFGGTVAYLAEDGFWFDGRPIGQDRVNRTFLGLINEDRLFTVLGRSDPVRPLFWWHYRTSESATYDRALVYNWQTDDWAEIVMDVLYSSEAATPGVTLEQLGALYATLEDVPFSFDSRVWLGGRPVYAIIDTDKKLAFLEGDNLAATLETGERQLIQGARARVRDVRPLTDAAATIQVGTRETLTGSRSWSAVRPQMLSGVCKANDAGRYHRFRLNMAAAAVWTHAIGVDVESVSRMGGR